MDKTIIGIIIISFFISLSMIIFFITKKNINISNKLHNTKHIGKGTQIKRASSFITNIELFNIKPSTFYKNGSYSYLKKTIKEGLPNNECNKKYSNILFSLDNSCDNTLSNIAMIACDDNKKVMTLNGKNGSIECVNHDAHLDTCNGWEVPCCGKGPKLISLYDKQGNEVDDKCTEDNPCAPFDWDKVTILQANGNKYDFGSLKDCIEICKENINCNNCVSMSTTYRPVSTKKNEFIECKDTQS